MGGSRRIGGAIEEPLIRDHQCLHPEHYQVDANIAVSTVFSINILVVKQLKT